MWKADSGVVDQPSKVQWVVDTKKSIGILLSLCLMFPTIGTYFSPYFTSSTKYCHFNRTALPKIEFVDIHQIKGIVYASMPTEIRIIMH